MWFQVIFENVSILRILIFERFWQDDYVKHLFSNISDVESQSNADHNDTYKQEWKRVRGEKGEKDITPPGMSGGMLPWKKILNIPYFT